MNKYKNINLIKEIILSQNVFHLLPRDEDGLCVYDGDLYCNNNQLTSLPDGLVVNGNLYCCYNQLTSIPDGLVVKGNLYCYDNHLTSMPDNLMVDGNLYCNGNKITKEIKSSIDGEIIMGDKQQKIYDRVIKLNRLKDKIDE